MHAFAKAWDHKLHIKSIFMGDDVPELPDAAETAAMALSVAGRVKALRDRVEDSDPDLWVDLDNCIDEFENLAGIDNPYEAKARFNEALGNLYDQADYAKRIWID